MEKLKEELIDVCNASGLPLEAILFVTKDLWRDVQDTLESVKLKQASQEKEKEEKE